VSIRVACPRCGTEHAVYERAAGQRLRCAACHETFELPSTAAPNNQEGAAHVEREPPAPPIVGPAGAVPTVFETAAPAAKPTRKPVVFRKDRKSLEAEMDMTPMVDVTFQLLIFFMLTASFTTQQSLNTPKPESNQPSSQPTSLLEFEENPDYVVVRIDPNNTYYVSGSAWEDELEAPGEQDLLVKLRQARQGDGQGNVPTKLLVVAHGDALHEYVVAALDAGNDVGMDEVQLITVEDDSEF